jgi:hypothetical protein
MIDQEDKKRWKDRESAGAEEISSHKLGINC